MLNILKGNIQSPERKKNWKEGFFWNFHRCRIIGNIC